MDLSPDSCAVAAGSAVARRQAAASEVVLQERQFLGQDAERATMLLNIHLAQRGCNVGVERKPRTVIIGRPM